MPSTKLQKTNREKTPPLEALNDGRGKQPLELIAALNDDGAPLTINDLPKELLVSVIFAVGDDRWVTRAPSLASARSGMSPLHETLEVDSIL